jgi:putative addiction module component (TIGR02574 family)
MVNPPLQSAIEAMTLDERLELVEYIKGTVPVDVTERQKATIRSRAVELEVDPSIGLSRGELKARLAARRA